MDREGIELKELYTILLYTKLPNTLSETIKRKCGDKWLEFEEFKREFENEIRNLRAFPQPKLIPASTTATFAIDQSQEFVPLKSDYKGNTNTGTRPKVKSRTTCSLCEGEHLWINCKTYRTREKKFEILKKFKLCFMCGSDQRKWIKNKFYLQPLFH